MKGGIFEKLPLHLWEPDEADIVDILHYYHETYANSTIALDNYEMGPNGMEYTITFGTIEGRLPKTCKMIIKKGWVDLIISKGFTHNTTKWNVNMYLDDIETWIDGVKKLDYVISKWVEDYILYYEYDRKSEIIYLNMYENLNNV